MARIDTLANFLTDVAEAIRTKEGTTETIAASEFDTRISNLSGGEDSGTSSESVLPSGYTQLEYVSATGTQYVDAGFIPTEKTNFEVTFSTQSGFTTSSFDTIFGTRYTYNANGYHLTTYPGTTDGSTSGHFLLAGTRYSAHLLNTGVKQTAKFEDGILTGGDGTTVDLSSVTTSPSNNLYLFAAYDTAGNTVIDYASSVNLYACSFSQDGAKIRDFVPAVNNNDGIVGLFDIINNVFYHSGSGVELIAGPAIETPSNLSLQDKDIVITSNGKQTVTFDDGYDGLGHVNITTSVIVDDDDTSGSILPTGYVRLRYLLSSDKQYIDTGVIPNANTGFDIDYIIYDQLSSNDTLAGALLGGRNDYYSNAFVLTTYSAGSYTNGHMLYGTVLSSSYVDNIRNNAGIIPNTRQQISFRKGVLTKPDGTSVTLNVNNGLTCDYPIYLFALNNRNSASEYATARIYSVKIYDGDTLLRNYVPALEKATGTPGLYDLITESFETGVTNGYPFSYSYAEDVEDILYKPRHFSFQGYTGTDLNYEVANIDTVNMTSFYKNYGLFYSCSNITSLDLLHWDTSNVTNMYGVFSGCSKLTSLDVSTWDISNVTSIQYIFHGCSNLTSLDVSEWNTANVGNMGYAFFGNSSLTSLDLSSWTFRESGGVNMDYMFDGCTKLTHLDIRNLDFGTTPPSSYTSMLGRGAGYYVPYSCEIIVKDEAAKEWLLSVRSNLSNIKTLEEYEAEQSA